MKQKRIWKNKELKIQEVPGVEVLAVGEWNGDTYSIKDLDNMVEAFEELRGQLDPPIKIGHDEKQGLLEASGLQKDGDPAAGWVEKLYRRGTKLIADLKEVPEKIAELIQAGAYKKRSAEVYIDYKVGNKIYPRVLKAVGLLGAEIPAVKNIDDIRALYREKGWDQDGARVAIYEESHDQLYRRLQLALQKEHPSMMPMEASGPWISEVFDENIIVEQGGHYYRLPYIISGEEIIFGEPEEVTEKREWIPISPKEANKMAEWDTEYINDLPDSAFALIREGGEKDEQGKTIPRSLRFLPYRNAAGNIDLPHLRNALARLDQTDLTPEEKAHAKEILEKAAEQEGIGEEAQEIENQARKEAEMEKKLRELLGLDERVDVLEAIRQLKAKAEANPEKSGQYVDLTEHRKAVNRIGVLEAKLAGKEADEAVEVGIREGKVLPRQREWAHNYALNDPEGFKKYLGSAPKVVDYSEKGSEEDRSGQKEPTETELRIAQQMGVTKEQLIAAKAAS